MIQRIQTVYLLGVAGLFIALLFLPPAILRSGNVLYSFQVAGLQAMTEPVELVYPTWSLFALAAIIILLSFFIIFSYKKRIRQMRMCVFTAILIVGFCILFGVYLFAFNKLPELQNMKIHFRIWASFPIIALILIYLAIRNIGVDEAMVRSLERLR